MGLINVLSLNVFEHVREKCFTRKNFSSHKKDEGLQQDLEAICNLREFHPCKTNSDVEKYLNEDKTFRSDDENINKMAKIIRENHKKCVFKLSQKIIKIFWFLENKNKNT